MNSNKPPVAEVLLAYESSPDTPVVSTYNNSYSQLEKFDPNGYGNNEHDMNFLGSSLQLAPIYCST
jgi:hypothetical protein